MPDGHLGVADRLHDLLVQCFGSAPALTITGWDGSRAGEDDSVILHVGSRKAVRRLLWTPGPLGVAQAYATAQIDVDGDFAHAVRVLLDYLDVTAAAGPLGAACRREILRVAVITGAVGPAARPPDVLLAVIDGYAAVDQEIADLLKLDLANRVLGDVELRAAGSHAMSPRVKVAERFVTYPEPLSALLRRWEDEGITVESVDRIDEEHVEVLRAWSAGLEREWDAVCAAVGEEQARAWRLGLALDREYIERGTAEAYQVCGAGLDD